MRLSLFRIILLLAPGSLAAAEPPSFARDVLPVLERHCVDCHSGWFPKGGLRLDSLENLRKGGPSGPTIVPGKPDKGWIPYTLNLDRGRYRMPPPPASISAEEKRLILDWIEQGARP